MKSCGGREEDVLGEEHRGVEGRDGGGDRGLSLLLSCVLLALSASLRVNRLWEERSDLKSSPKLLPHVLAQLSLALFTAQAADGGSLEVWELQVQNAAGTKCCRFQVR